MLVDVKTLAEQINQAAAAYRVGALQQLRRGLGRNPRTNKIFTKSTIMDKKDGHEYAFHWGGRTELQFNVAMELRDGKRWWRHGVAFSFEKSRTLPDPSALLPSVGRFNTWVSSNADALRGFRMWDWEGKGKGKGDTRSEDRPPGEILSKDTDDLSNRGKFVFLGKMVPEAEVDVTQILRDFDRLFPLYEHCLKGFPSSRSDCASASSAASTHTVASRLAAEIEVDLRHNLLRESLVRILEAEFPGRTVHPEWEKVANDCRVDVAVDTRDGFLFCEIKVAPHVRDALRQAIGQLLEYAYWPNDRRAEKLWVVSQDAPSAEDVAYLQALRARYGLPIFYRRIDVAAEVLGPET
jgi:hypothetical protein